MGLGGVFVEILQDVALRVLPVTTVEVRRMLAELNGASMLEGQRGVPAANIDAVAQVIARIGDAAVAPLSATLTKIGATLSTSTFAVSVLLESPKLSVTTAEIV